MRVVTGGAWFISRRVRIVVAAGILAVGVVALILVGWAERKADTRFDPVTTPALAVLGLQPPRLMLLDPVSLEIERTIALRSESLDVDSCDGFLVSAQCGGPGPASDTAVCVIEPPRGSVTYVDTGYLDPEQLCSPRSGDNRWPVLHGQVEGETPLSVTVNPADRKTEPFTLPAGATLLERAGENHVVVALDGTGQETDDARYRLWISNGGPFELLPPVLPVVTSVWDAGESTLFACVGAGASLADVYRLDSSSILSREMTIAGFVKGPGAVAECGGYVAVADFDWRDPLDAGEAVVIAQSGGDGSDARRITGLGGPIQFATDAGSLFVLCSTTGEIARVDPLSGRIEARTGIGREGTDLIDVTVWRPE